MIDEQAVPERQPEEVPETCPSTVVGREITKEIWFMKDPEGEQSNARKADEAKEEGSGMRGGGAGRREEMEGSDGYPIADPHVPGSAEIDAEAPRGGGGAAGRQSMRITASPSGGPPPVGLW